MTIEKAISIFEKSSFSKMKIGAKTIDVIIDSYASYKNGFLLIPVHASMLPGSYLYYVDSNGNIKELMPLEVTNHSSDIGQVHKI